MEGKGEIHAWRYIAFSAQELQICEILLFLNFQTKDILTKCCAERSINGLQTVIIEKELCLCLVFSEMEGKTKMIFTTRSLSVLAETENMS